MSSPMVQLGEGISASRLPVPALERSEGPQLGPSSNPGSDLSFAERLDRAVKPDSTASTQPPSEGFKTQFRAPRLEDDPSQSKTRPEGAIRPLADARGSAQGNPEASSSDGRAPKAASVPPDRSSQPEPQRQTPGTRDATASQLGAIRSSTPPPIVSTRTATPSPAGLEEALAALKKSAVTPEPSSPPPAVSQASEAVRASITAPDPEILVATLPLLQMSQNSGQTPVVQPGPGDETSCANTNVGPQTSASDLPAAPALPLAAVPPSLSANAQACANIQESDQPAEPTPAVAPGVSPDSQASANAQPANPTSASAEAPELVGQALRVVPPDTSGFQDFIDAQAKEQAPSAVPRAQGAHDEAPGELTQLEKPAANTGAVEAAQAEKANSQPALELQPGVNATASKVGGDSAAVQAPEASQAAEAVESLASGRAATPASPQASPGLVAAGTASNSADSISPGQAFVSIAAAPVSGTSSDSSGNSGDGSSESSSNSSGQDSNRVQPPAPGPAFSVDAGAAVTPANVHAAASAVLQTNTGADGAAAQASATPLENANFVSQERAFAAWQSTTEQLGRIVNAATLNSAQNGVEMRVQFRTPDFGPMELLATLAAGKVGAAISVEDSEAHNALLRQLPALEQSLAERQVQLDHISVVSSFGQGGTGFGTSSQRYHDDPKPSGEYTQQLWKSGQPAPEPVYAPATETWLPESSWGRLNVRA